MSVQVGKFTQAELDQLLQNLNVAQWNLFSCQGELARAKAEIARLKDELESATRHMELAEAAWLRETAGNSPTLRVFPDRDSAGYSGSGAGGNAPDGKFALVREEQRGLHRAIAIAESMHDVRLAKVLNGILERAT